MFGDCVVDGANLVMFGDRSPVFSLRKSMLLSGVVVCVRFVDLFLELLLLLGANEAGLNGAVCSLV